VLNSILCFFLFSSDGSPGSEAEADSLRETIENREKTLLPLYAQISYEFADLHDRPGEFLFVSLFLSLI